MQNSICLLYCRCAHAQVLPPEVKDAVLKGLCESGREFEAVADICEMSAQKDTALKRLAEAGTLKIAACYPRAVQWLFAAGGASLQAESVEVLNMRTQTADEVTAGMLSSEVRSNLSLRTTGETPASPLREGPPVSRA